MVFLKEFNFMIIHKMEMGGVQNAISRLFSIHSLKIIKQAEQSPVRMRF